MPAGIGVLHLSHRAAAASLRGVAFVLRRGGGRGRQWRSASATRRATVHQLASELRAGRTEFFRSSEPGPKGPRKSATVRDKVLKLRAEERSVTEIAAAISAEGTPVSVPTVWGILHAEGIERLSRRPTGPAPRLDPVRAKALSSWPAGSRIDCDHAGLYLLVPELSSPIRRPECQCWNSSTTSIILIDLLAARPPRLVNEGDAHRVSGRSEGSLPTREFRDSNRGNSVTAG